MTPLQLALLLRMAELAAAQNTYTPLARVEEMRMRVQALARQVEAERLGATGVRR